MNKNHNNNTIKLQGHRGCTGCYPENSIAGFLHAIDLGVSAIELDIVVSKDHQLIVSHDPFFRSEICRDAQGNWIPPEDEKYHNIYNKTLDEIKKYTCGNDAHFGKQKSHNHSKPTLYEVISSIQDYCAKNEIQLPQMTIEIKSRDNWDEIFHPTIKTWASLIDQFDRKFLSNFDVLYHSFDIRILKALSLKGYSKLDYLIEKNVSQLDDFLDDLDFTLNGVGVHFPLIDADMLKTIADNKLTLSAWTVNTPQEVESLLELGVKNIITDYPLMAREVILQKGFEII